MLWPSKNIQVNSKWFMVILLFHLFVWEKEHTGKYKLNVAPETLNQFS